MILTITAAYDVWTSDLYQKNEALIYSFGMIVILLLVIMIIISISKSKRLKTLQRINEVAEESNQLKNAFMDIIAPSGKFWIAIPSDKASALVAVTC